MAKILKKHKYLLGRPLSPALAREGCHPCFTNLPKATAAAGQSRDLNPTPVFHLLKDAFHSCPQQPWETGRPSLSYPLERCEK